MNTKISGPLISLIVPVYNVKDYLENCLKSILEQTYINLEIVLVDDGSNDGSDLICDEYALIDKRIKVIHLPHGGVSAARNAGLDAATGELLGFVDSDDWIDRDMYEYLYQLLIENDADVSICTYLLEQEGRPSKIINNTGKLHIFTGKEIVRVLTRDELVKNYLWGKLFKRKLFNRLSFPIGRVYEDVAVLYKVFYKSRKVVMSCVSKYHYMIHRNESITRGSYDPLKEYHYFLSLYEQDKFIQEMKLGNESSVRVLKRGIHLINHTLLCPPSPAFDDIIEETMLKMREYRHITSWQLGPSMSIKRYFIAKHFSFYRMLYRGYRAIFKRKYKLLID